MSASLSHRATASAERATWIAACLVLTALPAAAHPTATTDVAIAVGRDAVAVTMTSDAEALQQKLDALQRPLEECLALRFDGAPAPLARDGDTTLGEGRVAIRLRASIPRGACGVPWRASFVYGSYPLVMLGGGARRDNTHALWD